MLPGDTLNLEPFSCWILRSAGYDRLKQVRIPRFICCFAEIRELSAMSAIQAEMAERKKQRMYFVREPSQAQSSDTLDAEIASLIEKATKHREQLDKLDIAFNEARVSPGRLGKILERRCNVSHRLAPLRHCSIGVAIS